MRILAVGDSYMPPRYFAEAFSELEAAHVVEYMQVDDTRRFEPSSPSELKVSEYQGSPAEVVERMPGVEVLVVHGAPVTDKVLGASAGLQLVCCARGGPVNVDVESVSARRLPLVATPGKNADAVADLTIAFLVMLARGLPRAQRFLEEGNQLRDNWEGAKFMGSDLRRHVLGIVGYGQVGRRVAQRALPFGMSVVAYDPYASIEDWVEQVDSLDELLGRADFVSLHARATSDNENLIDSAALARMKSGAFLVNTARETLVDEDALDEALARRSVGRVAKNLELVGVHQSSIARAAPARGGRRCRKTASRSTQTPRSRRSCRSRRYDPCCRSARTVRWPRSGLWRPASAPCPRAASCR